MAEAGARGEIDVVRAAGGLVHRDGRVLLVHRPRYDDWTFPKGKAHDSESDDACALREVREETAVECALERELPQTGYVDARGRPKRVRWWLMRPLAEGAFEPNAEIDEIRWSDAEEAATLLTYEHDLPLLAELP